MRFLIPVLVLTFLVALGSPASAGDRMVGALEGAVEHIDRKARTFVVEGIPVKVPHEVRGFRKLRTGEPVFVELKPGTRPARAVRLEPVVY